MQNMVSFHALEWIFRLKNWTIIGLNNSTQAFFPITKTTVSSRDSYLI